ncbi:MAG TPA: hypothetical protein VEY71_10465 [Chitinophagales bacterium]|nr:hypothetical protein [Chitinophagales bacterium]
MVWHELDHVAAGNAFSPETAEVENLPLFINLKNKMAQLGWVYDGSLRWSEHLRMLRVVYTPGQCAVLELWNTNGSNDLLRRIGTDCSENGLVQALFPLGISP